MRGFFSGVVFTLALIVAAVVAAVKFGAVYPGADVEPPALERLAATTSLHEAIDRDTKGLRVPIEATTANLLAAVPLYGENCSVCHGASDGKKSRLASGFYIASPQLASDGVEDDPPSETYWKLKHGIRFTAMPAFGKTLSDEQLWQIALFVSKMDKLPPEVDVAWKHVPSVAPSPSDVSPAISGATPEPASAATRPGPAESAAP